MGVEFRPGLQASFGKNKSQKTQTVAQQASQNLSTGSATRPNAFSFRNTRNWVSGQNTIKGRMQYDFQGARASLNPRTYTAPMPQRLSAPILDGGNTNIKIDNGSDYMKGQIIGGVVGGVLQGVFGMLNKQGAGTVGSMTAPQTTSTPTTAGATLNAAMEGLGGVPQATTAVSSAATSAISNMSSASNSATLRQAIGGAENQLAQLAYANTPETQAEYNTAKATYEEAKGEVKTCKDAVSTAEQEVSTAKQSVETLTQTRDTKKSALTNAMTKKNQCDSKYATAHANTVAAQSAYDNTPDKITDANGNQIDNPAKKVAHDNLEKAKAAEDEAKKSLDEATQNAIAADDSVKQAEEQLKAEQKKLTEKENVLSKKEDALKKAENDLKAAEKKRDDAKAKMDKIDSDKKDYATLQNEIKNQKVRLEKLEQEEQNKFNDLSGKIDKKAGEVADRATRIDASDGMNISERIRQKKNERANAKIQDMTAQKDALSDNVAITNLLRDNNYTLGKGGEELRTGTLPSGRTVYYIGTREVTQADYEAAKA